MYPSSASGCYSGGAKATPHNRDTTQPQERMAKGHQPMAIDKLPQTVAGAWWLDPPAPPSPKDLIDVDISAGIMEGQAQAISGCIG